ncbi:MAG TPA: TonB-dependent receptor plug domain-containing protein, partial [Hydrogenophaga sp.]|nr:TonB-dependent receptor plug domain-containing protein [Hydrogenophaga sp.]
MRPELHSCPARRSALARAALLSLSAALWAAPSFQALAQDTPNPSVKPVEPTLDTVVVTGSSAGAPTEDSPDFTARTANTATRLDLTPRETPQSVSVVTNAQMQAFGLRDARTLLSSVTGMNVELVETDRAYYSVRGFEVTNFQFDGVGLPFATGDQLGDIDTAIFDRVEVLRGANGLMSSTGNPSATVNFVRKRPTAQFQASGGLTLGSWQQRRVDADLAGALNASGSVRGRLVQAAEDKESYLDHYGQEKQVFYGVVEADLSPSTLLTLGHTQQENRPRGVLWGALPMRDANGMQTDYPVSTSTSAPWTYWDTQDTNTFAELSHQFANGWAAKGVLTRRELRSDGEMLYVYGAPDPVTGAGLFSWPSKYHHSEEQWIADVHVSGPFELAGRRHQAVLGLSSSRSDSAHESSEDDVGIAIPGSDVFTGRFPRPAFDQGISGYAEMADR